MRPFQTVVKDPSPERVMTTSQIRIKAINRWWKMKKEQDEAEEERLNKLSSLDTIRVNVPGVMTRAIARLAKTTRPMLALDDAGRPYLIAKDASAKTADLIKDTVNSYFLFEDRCDEVILLSPLRYLSLGAMTHYKIGTTHIPIAFEPEAFEKYGYDVMVRGK